MAPSTSKSTPGSEASGASADETDDELSACQGCGRRRRLEICYTIEDLDALGPEQRQQLLQRGESRKYKSFLSPDDALRDLRKHASQGAEIRWEMHTSRTDVNLTSRARCGCHAAVAGGSLTPGSEKRHPERPDLRKHHSAEGDKWSLRPDAEYDLRKHLSDDSRMHDREPKWTLQVPELHVNPRQRCTCPRQPRALSLTPSPSPSGSAESRRPSPMLVRSLTPELPPMRRRGESVRRRQQRASLSPEQPAPSSPRPQPQPQPQPEPEPEPEAQPEPPPPPQQQQQQERVDAKKASKRERAQLGEARRAIRSKWAVKPHFSLPAERREERWSGSKEAKSKSLKERPKYSVRRSMSPEPDQILRTDNRVVRRLISADVQLRDAKWAPYEGHSPLPAVGIRKRETKKISDIQWRPCDESPIRPKPRLAELRATSSDEEETADGPEDFHKITPPRAPPPEPSADELNEEERFRMRMLNQVSCFPIYQGAWREESPPRSPPPPPADLSTPVWSPHDASTVTAAQLRKQSLARRSPSPSPQPSVSPAASPAPPLRQRSTLRARVGRKKAARAKSQEAARPEQRKRSSVHAEQLARAAAAASGPEGPLPARPPRRPQLLRASALALEPPARHAELAKRSLSEEVRSYNPRSESTRRGLFSRAKSEDASRSRRPWSPDEEDESELREYVTTV
ncbi:serine/arginine repetitive matrix protein 1-like [Phymastichus coffea]|uniref:serine/arginine repetitive matrix protein 1-like n=1 Tax=Phymastichus coffea TaxID=108790 RepID=UPI00273C8356|nr:serine/arginine repetitive matrix protein 1-like [Phymastichus coffea]